MTPRQCWRFALILTGVPGNWAEVWHGSAQGQPTCLATLFIADLDRFILLMGPLRSLLPADLRLHPRECAPERPERQGGAIQA